MAAAMLAVAAEGTLEFDNGDSRRELYYLALANHRQEKRSFFVETLRQMIRFAWDEASRHFCNAKFCRLISLGRSAD